ncbi:MULTISPECIES: DMT family transporter [unclassified Thermosipho (in: thermotogales)]|uniref:DMT family transporter n=2 Tax=Thermosipho TaxID=2420 RepID=UPI002100E71E|nr:MULTISPECIES: EamA family transporter [unclassified Thermosipho (in: thermotogales)]
MSGLFMAFIFGLSFLFTKNALDYTSPMNFIAIRFTIASLFLFFLSIFKIISLQRKNYFKLLIVSLFQPILYFIFETSGLLYIPSSEAGILIASIPIFITFLTPIVLKEKVHNMNFLFVFLSFFGVLLIIGFNNFKGNIKGDLLILCAVFSATFYNFTSRKFSKEFQPVEITFFMMIIGAIFFNALAIIREELDYTVLTNIHVLIPALYLGILSSSVAFFLVNYMLSKISPTQSSIFANLTTVTSVLAGALFRNEQITLKHIIGMTLIILGVWGVNYYKYNNS